MTLDELTEAASKLGYTLVRKERIETVSASMVVSKWEQQYIHPEVLRTEVNKRLGRELGAILTDSPDVLAEKVERDWDDNIEHRRTLTFIAAKKETE